MVFAYPRARWVARVVAQDVLLAIALAWAAWTGGALGAALGAAILATASWGLVTLHNPSRVETSDDGIAFSAYGRTHAFRWRDIGAVHVRRFVVRDRVLVRFSPSSAWRGRYWVTDGLNDYEALVRELERRAKVAPRTVH
jgi:hypothetical protein